MTWRGRGGEGAVPEGGEPRLHVADSWMRELDHKEGCVPKN